MTTATNIDYKILIAIRMKENIKRIRAEIKAEKKNKK